MKNAMDYPLPHEKRRGIKWFYGFQYLDLFPYSLALIMMTGCVYIIATVIEITHHAK